MARTLPQNSSSAEAVMSDLRAMQGHDGDYRASRTWGLIYNAGPEVDRLLHEVADHTLKENALNPLVFPSLREMQRDVVSIAADLFHGGEDCRRRDDVGRDGVDLHGGEDGARQGASGARREARHARDPAHGAPGVREGGAPARHRVRACADARGPADVRRGHGAPARRTTRCWPSAARRRTRSA